MKYPTELTVLFAILPVILGLLYIILCFIVAEGWRLRGLSYVKGLVYSFFFDPVVGILLGLLYVSEVDEPYRFKFEPVSEPPEITPEERVKLKLAGEDAVNYAYATETEWVCVCGTYNPLDKTKKIQNCSHCHRNRDFTLANYGKPR